MPYIIAWFDETEGDIEYLVTKCFVSATDFFNFLHKEMPMNWELNSYDFLLRDNRKHYQERIY